MTTTDEKIDELSPGRGDDRPPGGNGKRRAKPSLAQLAELQMTTAYNACVARAAKPYGVPLAEGLDRFGPVDSPPRPCL